MAAKTTLDWIKSCQAAYDLLRGDRMDGAVVFTNVLEVPQQHAFVRDHVETASQILRDALADRLDRHRGRTADKVEASAQTAPEFEEVAQGAYDLLRGDRQTGALALLRDRRLFDRSPPAQVEWLVEGANIILSYGPGENLDRYPSKVELERWKGVPNSPYSDRQLLRRQA